MTNELEKQGLVSSDKRARISGADDSSSLLEIRFFDTFGIEPKYKCTDGALEPCNEQCNECGCCELKYPQITDAHYLKLICELSKCKAYFNNFYRFQNVDIEQLKEQVLTDCIYQAIYFKHQVHTLFEEG